ncbi:MAG: alkene reductase [Gemmatimonadota bacterium]
MSTQTLEPRAAVAPLFRPLTLGALKLPHRIVMSPMTRNRAGEGNVPTDLSREYYRQRASAALIVTEASQVSAEGVGYPSTPGIHSDDQVEGWRAVTDAVHAEGGRIYLQLWHVGRISHPVFHDGALPVAPSAIRPEGSTFTTEGMKDFVTPRALDTDEIPRIVEDFRRGAQRAQDAGFDGVEIHGANGYLLDQFLRDRTNQRTDRYGGSVEKRMRFPLAVVDAVVEVWGADRVGFRVSPLGAFNDMSDSNPEALFGALAKELGRRGLAYLHVIVDDAFEGDPRSFDPLSLGELFGGAVIAASGFDAERGARVIEAGRADAIAFGRAFLANPDLPRRIREAAELNEPDPDTFYGGGAEGYVDYPALGD